MDRVKDALQFISSDDRGKWVSIGMAIKSEFGDLGRSIWDEWSRQSEKYNEKSASSVWKSIKSTGGVTLGTLYHEAKSNGWADDGEYKKPSKKELEAIKEQSRKRAEHEAQLVSKAHREAAIKAKAIVLSCRQDKHAYMDSKGLGDVLVFVWQRAEYDPVMVIPMREDGRLTGCQLINIDGKKKFLPGQKSSMSEYVIGTEGSDWFVEGYASGISLMMAIDKLNEKYRIHVCFSAGNMIKIAKCCAKGFVCADNDESGTGEKAAKEIGFPYWIKQGTGDINDFHQEVGLFRLSQNIRKFLHNTKGN